MDFESQLALIQDSFEYHISLDYPLKNEKKKNHTYNRTIAQIEIKKNPEREKEKRTHESKL